MATGAAYAAVAGYQIISGFQQAELVRENAKITRELADMNAQAAELDAYHAEQDGLTQAARYQTVIDQTLGDQKVAFAARGVDINFGTAAALRDESKLAGELNQMDIRARAQAQALGYKDQARNIRLQSFMDNSQSQVRASSLQGAAILGAATSLSGYSKERTKPSLSDEGSSGGSAYKTHTTGQWESMIP